MDISSFPMNSDHKNLLSPLKIFAFKLSASLLSNVKHLIIYSVIVFEMYIKDQNLYLSTNLTSDSLLFLQRNIILYLYCIYNILYYKICM